MITFNEWLGKNKIKAGITGLALAGSPFAYNLVKNEPSIIEPEVTYEIKVIPKTKELYYVVTFSNINIGNHDYPVLIRRFKQEAKDAVIDKILDDKSISFKTGNQIIRTAGINKLEFVDIKFDTDAHTIKIIMKTDL